MLSTQAQIPKSQPPQREHYFTSPKASTKYWTCIIPDVKPCVKEKAVWEAVNLTYNMNYDMEDSQNAAPGHATVHEASKLTSNPRRQDAQSVTKRYVAIWLPKAQLQA